MAQSEFELIRRYFTGLGASRDDVATGVGDDAALLVPTPGCQLAVTTDTLAGGVHFPMDAPAESIGHKALAVNLSDLAAMGAEPAWVTLALTLPEADESWLVAFASGFGALALESGVAVVGGDLCRGPLSATVQAMGQVPAGQALHRSGAAPGDAVFVSGTLGDATLGLRIWQSADSTRGADEWQMLERLHRPSPRLLLGRRLRGCASAAIDVSDGLIADLGHLLEASGAGARLEVDRLPLSDAGLRLAGSEAMRDMALAGGDDYELCFTVPPQRLETMARIAGLAGVSLTRVGVVEREPGLRLVHDDGTTLPAARAGYRHFGA